MIVVKVYSVFCDNCPDWVAETTEGSVAARRIAKAAGWKVRGGDLCPWCQRKLAGLPPQGVERKSDRRDLSS